MNQPNIAPQSSGVDTAQLDFSKARVAYIEAGWHNNIVSQARLAFTENVSDHGISKIDLFEVPGSLEIPLQAKLVAATGQYDIIVACGLIVDGGIYRHDFVARTVLDAMMQVSLESEIPVLSVVLTPHNFHEHEEHVQYFHTHFLKKGKEAAAACIKTLANMHCLDRVKLA